MFTRFCSCLSGNQAKLLVENLFTYFVQQLNNHIFRKTDVLASLEVLYVQSKTEIIQANLFHCHRIVEHKLPNAARSCKRTRVLLKSVPLVDTKSEATISVQLDNNNNERQHKWGYIRQFVIPQVNHFLESHKRRYCPLLKIMHFCCN